jgi:hypothetical protein
VASLEQRGVTVVMSSSDAGVLPLPIATALRPGDFSHQRSRCAIAPILNDDNGDGACRRSNRGAVRETI